MNSKAADLGSAQTWEELMLHQVPDWYRDAKFGIYMHWGVYSVPAFSTGRATSDKYSRAMYVPMSDDDRFGGIYEHHVDTYGAPQEFGYKEFVPMWRAEKWDPQGWVNLFAESGAQFVGLNAEHHDSFLLWDSNQSKWNAAQMGPRRDIVAELEKNVRLHDLKFFLSLHNVRNWRWYEHAYGLSPLLDIEDERYARIGGIYPPFHSPGAPMSHEYIQFWCAKLREVVDRFCPDYLWFDSCVNELPDQVRRWAVGYFYSAAERRDRKVIINNKRDRQFPDGVGVYNLEGHELMFDEIRESPWDTDAQILRSQWAYSESDPVKPFGELLEYFVNILSMNGNLILNVSPRADGTLPDEQQDRLRRLGGWLALNGEAVYGTRAWKQHRQGETIWFTQSKDGRVVYVFHRGPLSDHLAVELHPAAHEMRITLLGDEQPLRWSAGPDGVLIDIPTRLRSARRPQEGQPILVFRVEHAGEV